MVTTEELIAGEASTYPIFSSSSNQNDKVSLIWTRRAWNCLDTLRLQLSIKITGLTTTETAHFITPSDTGAY